MYKRKVIKKKKSKEVCFLLATGVVGLENRYQSHILKVSELAAFLLGLDSVSDSADKEFYFKNSRVYKCSVIIITLLLSSWLDPPLLYHGDWQAFYFIFYC